MDVRVSAGDRGTPESPGTPARPQRSARRDPGVHRIQQPTLNVHYPNTFFDIEAVQIRSELNCLCVHVSVKTKAVARKVVVFSQ